MSRRSTHRALQPLANALEKLAHAARTFRLTSGAEARRALILGEILALLSPVLDLYERIVLDVEPFRLLLDDAMVYEQTDRAESLAFRLFRDGIGALILRKGLSIDQLSAFVEILSVPPGLSEQLGEDMATRLWLSPLPAIEVTDRAWYAFRLMEPNNNDIQQLRACAADALVFFNTGVGPGASDISLVYTPRELGTLWNTLKAGHDAPSDPMFVNSRHDAHDGGTDASRLSTRVALEEFTTLLSAVVLSSGQEVQSDEIVALFLVLLRALLVFDEEQPLRQQLDELKALVESPALNDHGRRALLRQVIKEVASPQSLRHLLLAYSGRHSTAAYEWVPAFFGEHTRAPSSDFTPLFTLNLTNAAIALLARTLWRLEDANSEFWTAQIKALSEDVAPEVLSLILDANAISPEAPHPERGATSPNGAFKHALCLSALSHSSAEVRRIGIENLTDAHDQRVKAIIVETLKDPDSAVRVAALERLGQMDDPALGIFLVDRFRSAGFALMPAAEKESLVTNLVRLGGTRYLKIILNQLSAVEAALRDPDINDDDINAAKSLGACILIALARLEDPNVKDLIESREADAPADLRPAYAKAIEHLNLAPPKPPEASSPRLISSRPLRLEIDPLPPLVPSVDPSSEDNGNIDELLSAYLNEDASLQSMIVWQKSSSPSPEDLPWPPHSKVGDPIDVEAILHAYLEHSGPSQLEESPLDPEDPYLDALQPLESPPTILEEHSEEESQPVAPASTDEGSQSWLWDPSPEFLQIVDEVEQPSQLPFLTADSAMPDSAMPSAEISMLFKAPLGDHPTAPAQLTKADTPPTAPALDAPSQPPISGVHTRPDTPSAKEAERMAGHRKDAKGPKPSRRGLKGASGENSTFNLLAEASWMEAFDDPEFDGEVSELLDDLMNDEDSSGLPEED